MRSFYLFGVVLLLGCSSDKGSAAVDPASEDFCLKWANDVCRLAYLCVDAGAQDAAFHSRYGASQDDCWQSVEKHCTSNQSGSSAFGPSCGPGKKVNDALANACTDGLESESCALWTPAPAGPCESVCSTTGNTGSAGGPATGSGGTGAGGSGAGGSGGVHTSTGGSGTSAGASNTSTGPVTTSRQFCDVEQSLQCDRIFECEPQLAALLGTLADCKAAAASDCANGEYCPGGYDATKGPGCVTATKTATCAQLEGDPPEICTSACAE